jgi:hypothetical protein
MRTGQMGAVAVAFAALLACGGQILESSETGSTHPGASSSSSGGDDFADAGGVTMRDGSADATAADAAPPPADGICAATLVSAGVVDPDCVYLLGTLTEGDAWKDALIHVSRPNDFATGFGYVTFAPVVRPTDGRVLFEASGDRTPRQMYRFTASSTGLPDPALAAQTVESSVTCDPTLLDRFFVFPDDGAILYGCGNADFIAGSSQPIDMAGYLPIATGRNRLIVGAKTYPDIALVQNGAVTPVSGLMGRPYAFRSLASGAMWMATSEAGVRGELLEIAPDGSTKVVGTYLFGAAPFGPGPDCALEPSGALVCLNRLGMTDSFADVVVRFTFNSAPEILYDERNGVVKLHGSKLVTGP